LTQRRANHQLLVIVAMLSAAACQSSQPTQAEQDRAAKAMAKVEAEQAECGQRTPGRDRQSTDQMTPSKSTRACRAAK
jgi:hypothetical protein